MMKTTNFSKKDKTWDCCNFYKIYINNNIKMIKFIGITDRKSTGKDYLSWICTYCKDSCEMSLEDFLLWDVYYQLNVLIQRCDDNVESEVEPYECYRQANEWVKGDGEGSFFKKLLDLTEHTPCGYYYGY